MKLMQILTYPRLLESSWLPLLLAQPTVPSVGHFNKQK